MSSSPSIVPDEVSGDTDLVAWLINEAEQHDRAADVAAEPYGARLSLVAARNLRWAALIIKARKEVRLEQT